MSKRSLIIALSEDDGQFAIYCHQIGLATCGDTPVNAVEMFADALKEHVQAYKEELIEKECGLEWIYED